MKGSYHYGKNPLKQKKYHPMEAVKEVDTKPTGYSNQDKSKEKTEKEIYLAKLLGNYVDLTGEKGKESMEDDVSGTVVSKYPTGPFKHNKGSNHNKEFGQGHTWGARSKSGVSTHEVQGPTSNQQKSQSNYKPSPTKHVGGGATWWGLSKGNTDPVFHPHPHGTEGHIKRTIKGVGKAGKAVGEAVGDASRWVGRGVRKLGKIRIKGGGRGGYEMGPGGRGGWRG